MGASQNLKSYLLYLVLHTGCLCSSILSLFIQRSEVLPGSCNSLELLETCLYCRYGMTSMRQNYSKLKYFQKFDVDPNPWLASNKLPVNEPDGKIIAIKCISNYHTCQVSLFTQETPIFCPKIWHPSSPKVDTPRLKPLVSLIFAPETWQLWEPHQYI